MLAALCDAPGETSLLVRLDVNARANGMFCACVKDMRGSELSISGLVQVKSSFLKVKRSRRLEVSETSAGLSLCLGEMTKSNDGVIQSRSDRRYR